MKKNWQVKLFTLVLALTLVACKTLMGPSDDDIGLSSPPTSAPEEVIPDDAPDTLPNANNEVESCLESETYHPDSGLCYHDDGGAEAPFLAMMDGVTDYGDEDYSDEEETPQEVNLVIYNIDGDEIFSPQYEDVSADLEDEQEDTVAHEEIWDFFSAVVPADYRSFVTYYIVFTDGKNGTLAAVEQALDDPYSWMIEIDIADTADTQDLTFTLIHEFGHLLTLNAKQVEVDEYLYNNMDDDDAYFEAEDNCATYFTGEGCANSSSYFYLFFDEFWAGYYDEWLDIEAIEDDDAYYEASDEFYFAHENEFLSDYAFTNPGEDIAESWAFFVTHAKPAGNTIAEEKILFFYDFPELVALRSEIIARTYSRLVRMQ